MFWLHFLDWFFLVFHTLLTLFNLFGWVWKKTRKANLIVLLLTGSSWGILGIWYGFGYCPFTDWHWNVLVKLGHKDLPLSYIKMLIDRIAGTNVDAGLVEILTIVLYLFALVFSVLFNVKDHYLKKRKLYI